jgi:hypothetical protein
MEFAVSAPTPGRVKKTFVCQYPRRLLFMVNAVAPLSFMIALRQSGRSEIESRR